MEKLRVWWIRNVPATKTNPALYFPVKDIQEAIKKINELTKADLKDKSIGDNVGGLETFENNEWCEYYNDAGYDIMDIIDER